MTDNTKLKSQRKTKNLGFNTANTQDTSYALIETLYNTKSVLVVVIMGKEIYQFASFI
jgi:hypothetical protein